MPKNEQNGEKDSSWMGPKGFDEATYYNDEKFEIGPEEQSDERLKTKVKESLSRNTKLSAEMIEVEVNEGIVTLLGYVEGTDQKDEATNSIKKLAGIKGVQNHLTV